MRVLPVTAPRSALMWERWFKTGDRYDGFDDEGRLHQVQRHGTGRKYWEAHYPDGTHVDNFTTAAAAKRSCEQWEVDPTLVPLVDEETTPVVTPPATGQDSLTDAGVDEETTPVVTSPAEELLPFRSVIADHLWDASGDPVTRSIRAEALKNVATLAQMRATVEQLLRDQIAIARTGKKDRWGGFRYGDEPRTWSEIGAALGVSKQAAATRYGDKKD